MSALVARQPLLDLSDPDDGFEVPTLRLADLAGRVAPDPAQMLRVMVVGGPHGLASELMSTFAACSRRFEVTREPHSPEAVERIERGEVDVAVVFEDLAGRAVSQRVAERDLPSPVVCVIERGLERGRVEIQRKLRREWGVAACLFVNEQSPERLEDTVVHALEVWRLASELALQRRRRSMDPLTMMTSPAMLLQCLDELIDQGDPSRAAAVLLLQVERAEELEAQLGEETGQAVLTTLARQLRRCEPQAVIARQGTGRFAVLLDDATQGAVDRRAGAIGSAIRSAIPLGDDGVFLQISTGMAFARPDHTRGADVVRDAAAALSMARAGGGGTHAVYDAEMPAEPMEAARVAEALRNALDDDALSLVYLPIVDLETGWLRGLEALVRWNDGARGIQTAASFLPLAEEMDLLVPIGTWALETAVRQMASWNAEFNLGGGVPIAVNLSTPQVKDPLVVARIHSLLLTTGLPATALRIEIPASCLVEAYEAAAKVIEGLSALGVEVWIDDVGAAPLEIRDLPSLSITGVKIDKTCVDTLDGSAAGAAKARAIVEAARGRHWRVMAEGVENRLQANYLRLLGCRVGQGFLYDRPLGTGDAYRKLSQW